MRRISTILNVALLVGIALVGYYLIKSHVAADIYREKFEEVSANFEKLRTSYNTAVKKTAVTELLVNEDGTVCVVFVTLNGEEKIIPTRFKMGSEIFTDFIVIDGSAYFRRVFDENTKPIDALYINPQLQTVEWKQNTEERTSGNIAYAKLDAPGRWVVTVTGNKSLDIRKKREDEPPTVLVPSVQVQDYSEVTKEVNDTISDITFSDVMSRLFGGGSGGDDDLGEK